MALSMLFTITTSLCLLLLIEYTSSFQPSSCFKGTNGLKSATLSRPISIRPPISPSLYPRPIHKMGALFSSNDDALPSTTKEQYANKSILLTGASRGLGRSLAHSLSHCHPSTLILSGRDTTALNEVKKECLQINGNIKVECITADLTDKSSVEKLAIRSCEMGPIDVLINNGGISSRSSFAETKLEVDELLMQVNFLSGVSLAKKIVPGMVERGGGKIVWISSIQGKVGTPYRTSYAASKFAVQGYCEALRSELASSNISVHIASPGYIRTNLSMSAVMGDGGSYQKMDATTANGADPDQVANEILTNVASSKSDFVVAATFSAKAALWLKFLAPGFLEKQLVKRFEKGKLEMKKES